MKTMSFINWYRPDEMEALMSTMVHSCDDCGDLVFDNEINPPQKCSKCGKTKFSSFSDEVDSGNGSDETAIEAD